MPLPRLLFVGFTIQMFDVPAVLMLPMASPRVAPGLFLRGDLPPSSFLPLLGDLTSAICVEASDAESSVPATFLLGDAGPFTSVLALLARILLSMALQMRANSLYSEHASPADTMKVGGAMECTSSRSRSQ